MREQVRLEFEAGVVGAEVHAHDAESVIRRGGPPIAGVDGCPAGWAVAVVRGEHVSWHVAGDAEQVVALTDDCAAVGVDIPLGLPAAAGGRAADRAARALLRPYGSRVFSAPVRAVLAAGSYAEACAASRAVSGVALSRQTWNIATKVAQWDRLLTPALQRRVVEVHPELSFARLAGTVLAPKKSPAGRAARIAALGNFLADPGRLEADRPPGVRRDDALDALAAAWSAARWAEGRAEVLPDPPERDGCGRYLEIVV